MKLVYANMILEWIYWLKCWDVPLPSFYLYNLICGISVSMNKGKRGELIWIRATTAAMKLYRSHYILLDVVAFCSLCWIYREELLLLINFCAHKINELRSRRRMNESRGFETRLLICLLFVLSKLFQCFQTCNQLYDRWGFTLCMITTYQLNNHIPENI